MTQVEKIDHDSIKGIISKTVEEGRDHLTAERSFDLLSSAGINFADIVFAEDKSGVINGAGSIGYPVALKYWGDIKHKNKVGAVVLDIKTEDGLIKAYEDMMQIDEGEDKMVSVQEMVHGDELIVGGIRDEVFGPSVMFGTGGVRVEKEEDIVFRLAPLDDADAREMIKETRAGGGLEEDKISSVSELIQVVGHLFTRFDDIDEIDLNPVSVDSSGYKVLDVLIELTSRP